MDIVDDLRDLNSMHTPKEFSSIGERAADEIERLRDNAKQDAQYLLAYHRICQKHGFAPSSSDLIAALKENE